MGLTERHWFEDEEPELTENQIEDMLWERDKAYQAGYKKGLMDGSITASQAQKPVQAIQREIMHMLFWCCGSCGVAITEGDKFCRNCGKAVKWND